MTLSLKIIGQRDPLLSEVITLGEKNSKTLGMFPQGAFLDHAKKKTIFAAVDEDILAGYVLFRITQSKRLVCIAHLCIDPEYRNKGVARFLLNSVKERYKDILRGIALTCREDYTDASKLWTKFGFKPVDRNRSRSKDERYLIKWRYDFGNPDLFSDTEKQSSKVRALLDCSVIIPMCDDFSAVQIESQSLLADWLQEEAEFLYAQEIFNELNRDEDKTRAAKTRDFLRKFKAAKFKPDERDEAFNSLKAIIPGTSNNDASDRQQLAECISAGIKYFITLDQKILDKSNDLFSLYSLHVLSPTNFILLVDELSNTLDYHALRLAGANYHSGRLRSNEIERLIRTFSGQNRNETQHDIKSKIIKCVSNTEKGLVKIIRTKEGNEIAFYSLSISKKMEVQLVRMINSKIAPVLFQQIVKDLVDLANKNYAEK